MSHTDAANPYIHFERDAASQRITAVLQRREGDALPEEGESDSGVFFFRTAALRSRIAELLGSDEAIGRQTGELKFSTGLSAHRQNAQARSSQRL